MAAAVAPWTLGGMVAKDAFGSLPCADGPLRRSTGAHADGGVSVARVIAAFDRQRELLGRDLHDGAQQRLVALRIRLGLAGELAAGDPELSRLLDEIGEDVEAAIEELRDVAAGIYPHLLSDHGVAPALKQVARSCGGAVSVSGDGVGRHTAEVELAIYHCCREAIQNASKHGGPTVQFRISLHEDARTIGFEVSDDGPGFDLREPSGGRGLQHMRDRIGSVGGELSILSRPGTGSIVSGAIPRSRAR